MNPEETPYQIILRISSEIRDKIETQYESDREQKFDDFYQKCLAGDMKMDKRRNRPKKERFRGLNDASWIDNEGPV